MSSVEEEHVLDSSFAVRVLRVVFGIEDQKYEKDEDETPCSRAWVLPV